MTSHEYAKHLRQVADWFESRPDFETEETGVWMNFRITDKAQFLAAVRATKPGEKKIETRSSSYPEIGFKPSGLPKGTRFEICAPRDTVCRRVQEEKWECEAFLCPDEENELARA